MDIVRPGLNWKVNTNGNPRGYLHVLILRARSEGRDRSRVSKGRYRMCCLPQILMRNKRDVVLWQLLVCTTIGTHHEQSVWGKHDSNKTDVPLLALLALPTCALLAPPAPFKRAEVHRSMRRLP
jgi:hypothetical protein